MACTRHRVFLATLVVTAKYLHDSGPKNSHWAKFAVMFDTVEINLMEKQLLYLLDYDLRFDEEEACKMFAPFMSSRAQDASARAKAVDRVVKAGRARAEAQAQQVQLPPTPPEEVVRPLRSLSVQTGPSPQPKIERPSSKVDSSVKPVPVPPPMYSAVSVDSISSSSSSEMGSLIDDSGSSSSSSSGWMSSDCESSEDEQHSAQVYDSHASFDAIADQLEALETVTTGKKPFMLRPVPAYPYKSHRLSQNRVRKPSDTSSVNTITAASPPPPSLIIARPARTHRDPKRASSISISVQGGNTASSNSAGGGNGHGGFRLVPSSTMPSVTRTGVSGGFLSRMWGAATKMHDKERGGSAGLETDIDPTGGGTGVYQGHGHGGQSALRRLVQSSKASRGQGSIV